MFWKAKKKWNHLITFLLQWGIATVGCLLVCGSNTLFANDNVLVLPQCSSPWRIAVGTQWSHERPELHYTLLHDDSNPQLSINQPSTQDINPCFATFKLEKKLTQNSTFSLAYNHDVATSLLVGAKNVRLTLPFLRLLLQRPAILVRTTAQAPVTITTKQLKMSYEHAFADVAGIELGGGLGMQALYTQAKAAFPVLGYSKEEYFLVLPLVSLYARTEPLQRVRYALRAEYLPINTGSHKGSVAEIACTMDYQLNTRFFVGIGGHYTLKSFSIEDDDTSLHASYPLLGAMVYTGILL